MPQISDQRLKSMVGFLPEHRAHPSVSLQEHFSHRVAELARLVLARRRVYLDTRYWIFLRDAAAGRPRELIHSELLRILRIGVESGVFICPLSDRAFLELLRQSDRETRLATVRLIDELSLGVTIQNALDRLRTELLQFLVSVNKAKGIPGPPLEHVWLKVGHVLGTAVPIFPGVEATEQLAISKAFFDVMWSVTLEEILTDTPLPEDSKDSDFRNIAARTTEESTSHASDMKSFKAVYLAEIHGFFDVHREDLQAAFAQMYEISQPNAPPLLAAEFEQHGRVLVNVFSNIFRFGKAGTSLPMAQIVAGLHAVVRWQRNRDFKASDFYDFHHATAALPYCDVFLTECFLGTILTRPPLALDAHFGTKVLWDEADAAEALLKCAS
jgi:hypothetical protein